MINLNKELSSLYTPKERKIGRYWASDLWAIRHGYLTLTSYFKPEPIDIVSAFKMWNGAWKHKQFEELLELKGYHTEVKKEMLWNDFILVGKIDAFKDEELLEIKTSEEVMHKAKEWHIYQTKIYLTMFQLERGLIVQPVTKGHQLYLKILIKVERDDKWFEEEMDYLQEFHNKLKTL